MNKIEVMKVPCNNVGGANVRIDRAEKCLSFELDPIRSRCDFRSCINCIHRSVPE